MDEASVRYGVGGSVVVDALLTVVSVVCGGSVFGS